MNKVIFDLKLFLQHQLQSTFVSALISAPETWPHVHMCTMRRRAALATRFKIRNNWRGEKCIKTLLIASLESVALNVMNVTNVKVGKVER